MSASLAVVIVNWNTRALLAGCLESVAAAGAAAAGVAVRTVVVDNASTDGSTELVRSEFPWVELIANAENVGFARANNQALRTATEDYVLLLNSDTRLAAGALDALVDFMAQHPRAGAAGARLLNADRSLQVSCQPAPTPGREFWRLMFLERLVPRCDYPRRRWAAGTPQRVEVIKGACLLIRGAALRQIGLLDESFFMYNEETDLCVRLACAGWELWWVPEAEVTHFGEASSRQAAQAMYVQLYRSKVQYYRKHGGPPTAERFKRLVRFAYWPRLLAVAPAARWSSRFAERAGTFRRLLAELDHM